MSSVRDKAKKFLDQIPASGIVTSNGNPALFEKLTGTTHQSLQATWKTEAAAKEKARAEGKSTKGLPTTTTCNAFTGKLGHAIGSPIALGHFGIENELKKAGLGDAWIPAKSGNKPKYGDVFRPVKFHMGVSLDFAGNLWHTAEAGQGGPGVAGTDYTNGFDIVKKKQQQWNPAELQGWVDIDILMNLAQKAPKWMVGWWKFEVGTTKEFVYFAERGTSVRSVTTAPANLKLPPQAGGKVGELTYADDAMGVTIVWPNNVKDSLRRVPNVPYMLGNRGAPQLQAFKLT